jgi:hypothetical protein
MEMFSDMKCCLICVRYDFWFTESVRKKFIKIKKRKGSEYLIVTKAGLADGIKEGNVNPNMTKKNWKMISEYGVEVKDFKKRYVEYEYARKRNAK